LCVEEQICQSIKKNRDHEPLRKVPEPASAQNQNLRAGHWGYWGSTGAPEALEALLGLQRLYWGSRSSTGATEALLGLQKLYWGSRSSTGATEALKRQEKKKKNAVNVCRKTRLFTLHTPL